MNNESPPPRSFPIPLLAALLFTLGLGAAVTGGLSVGVGTSSIALGAQMD
ncbi:hypothetical protein [Jannaschia seohaensis]|uniref:Uncharacterized protein n=1 Tax=Jannaschia seohaensis TaxID=475081 RepID=A0A2Y9B5B9_9RHOB|nr:hypothetical protein [Jannaschia seohaensis]PWJ10336.1 hypothetical protein BCF38_12415 [Jannaschia seohaensis]SSA51736.1 hypothetical protein SAMN05421539_12415 [Jannaschia seohaensis]